jgi:hypothetical protein
MELARKRVLSWTEFCQFRTIFERHHAAFGKPEGMSLLVLDDPGGDQVAVACFIPEMLSGELDLCTGWARGPVTGEGWQLVVGRGDAREARAAFPFERDAMADMLVQAIRA